MIPRLPIKQRPDLWTSIDNLWLRGLNTLDIALHLTTTHRRRIEEAEVYNALDRVRHSRHLDKEPEAPKS